MEKTYTLNDLQEINKTQQTKCMQASQLHRFYQTLQKSKSIM